MVYRDIKEMDHCNLLQQGLAWVYCDALLISADNKPYWNKILSDWGTVLSGARSFTQVQHVPKQQTMFANFQSTRYK